MPENTAERRKYTRVEFNADAYLSQGFKKIATQIIDISLNGVLVETPAHYELNVAEPATIEIVLSNDTQINMLVNLAHSSSEMLGFHCVGVDIESLGHLRRLIELNIDDPSASERVLAELLQSNC
ncbi:PilZ domain-containing protein [Teredinibacter sp. KSP-S5-2]|uniref:PilZ domain-containing protein n=1 Tax=Teredinibacter sp. KSP-S5-2 TaxID=3034506 RepID=UPI002934A3FD|nr:PilZ domain-containing protein [Teredinibacter sp. KSP-S5-2]WNO09442.1 PilZ domain-containing protein [Teredinibacter sp. KSP-S5-2]